MADNNAKNGQGFATRMSHAGRAGTRVHGFVNPGVHRGSTVLHPNSESRRAFQKDKWNRVMTYGTAAVPHNTRWKMWWRKLKAARAACWSALAWPP